MSDIFDDKKDLRNMKSFVARLRDKYTSVMHNSTSGRSSQINLDQDEMRRMTHLAMQWPGDEIVGQILKDAGILSNEADLDISDLR